MKFIYIFCISMIYRISKFIYILYSKRRIGLSLLFFSVFVYFFMFLYDPLVADRSKLNWDYGYLEEVSWSERKGKFFFVVYSEKYKIRRYFSPISLLNEYALIERISLDSYYDRKVRIGWDSDWFNSLPSSVPTADLDIYEFEYKGDVLLSYEDAYNFKQKRIGSLFKYYCFAFVFLNLPYFYYLILIFGVKCYGWRK